MGDEERVLIYVETRVPGAGGEGKAVGAVWGYMYRVGSRYHQVQVPGYGQGCLQWWVVCCVSLSVVEPPLSVLADDLVWIPLLVKTLHHVQK